MSIMFIQRIIDNMLSYLGLLLQVHLLCFHEYYPKLLDKKYPNPLLVSLISFSTNSFKLVCYSNSVPKSSTKFSVVEASNLEKYFPRDPLKRLSNLFVFSFSIFWQIQKVVF
ncbi:hypothetical protein ACOSQ4_014668 [Xanthoceras sorbifolium]